MKTDILKTEDIKVMVDSFYGKVREDEMLKDIFNNVICDKWPEHLEKMYRFWQTVLLDEHTYTGHPFLPHARLPVDEKHFKRWLLLFHETVDANFAGDNAERVKWQGKQMAAMFLSKIEHYKNNPLIPIK